MRIALAESPHLLLLHLPFDSSAWLLEALDKTDHSAPAILMVEDESTPISVAFLRLGVRDYVARPFTAEVILPVVRRVLGQEAGSQDYRRLAEDLAGFNRELEQRVKEVSVLMGIGRSVSSLLDLDQVLNRVTEAAVFVTGAEEGYLLLLDEETGELRLRAAQNLGEKQAQGFSLRVEDSIAGAVVSSGKPILLSGDGGQNFKVKTGYLVKSLLNVPLKVRGRVIGVLGVDNQISGERFTLTHLRRLSELADVAATAVENARHYTRLHQKLTRRVREIATLQAVVDQLNVVTDFDVGARLALSLALKATNAEAGVLVWTAGDPARPTCYVSQGSLGELVLTPQSAGTPHIWWDEQTLRRVIETGQPILEDEITSPGNGHNSQARSRLVVPMRRGKKVMGAINLESATPNAFTQEDLNFVSSVADQVAIALAGTVLQERVETEQERLSLLMEAVNDAVWLVDADLRLMVQNEAAGQVLGWSLAEVVGRSVDELIPPSNGSPNELCQLLSRAMEERHRIVFDEGILVATKKDQPVLIGGRVVPIIREGRSVGAICAFRAIPPDKSDEHIRFEFANMTSHLLRTPLSSIQASIDLLLTSDLDAEARRETLTMMREQARCMRDFIKELLDMARVEAGAVQLYSEPVALLPLIDRILDMMRHEEAGHVFRLVAHSTPPVVAADPGKVELILLTLLRGAVRRCPDGGEITVEVEERKSEVVISVVDNGQAVPAQQLEKVFWQFYPVDDDGKMPATYQVGLYTARRLIEMQNGRMWAQSQPGKGSRFGFSLPVWG